MSNLFLAKVNDTCVTIPTGEYLPHPFNQDLYLASDHHSSTSIFADIESFGGNPKLLGNKTDDLDEVVNTIVNSSGIKYPKVNFDVPRKDVINKNILRSLARFFRIKAKAMFPELLTSKDPTLLSEKLHQF